MTSRGRFRVTLLALLVGLTAGAIGARLYQLQILRSEALGHKAEQQYQSRIVVPAMRGAILDRNGEPLAVSMESLSLFAHPREVTEPEQVAARLAPILGTGRKELRRLLSADKSFVYLQRFLEPEVADRIRELGLEVGPGHPLGFQLEPKRVYPHGQLAVHVVGYATIDGEGVEGIELQQDEVLRGEPTVYFVVQDARNRPLEARTGESKKLPGDVVLTIDTVLQHLVERELDAARRKTGARSATAIVLDPSNGEILALANRPAADANRFGRAPESERRNRAIVGYYEPGSTFKIVTMATALERGRIAPGQRIFCENGVYRAAGRRLIHDISPHGMLTPSQILEKSSNIGIAKVATLLSPSEMWEAIDSFGFGRRTGVDLPGESPGHFQRLEDWSALSQASLSFGQEIGVTALQMTGAMAILANDGVAVRPRVVLGTKNAGESLRLAPPSPARRVVSARTARQVGRMLERVVRNGTGRRGAVPGYRVAGKSGTAQKADRNGYSERDFVASFGGFAPVDRPRLVVLVVLDSPRGQENQGGQVAAPVFGRIMTEALRHLRVPSSDANGPRLSPRRKLLLTHNPTSDAGSAQLRRRSPS